MKKYRFILPLVVFPLTVLLFTGCPNGGPEDMPEEPTITLHRAVSDGADLELEWIDNTDGGSEIFYIYAGNTEIDSTFNLSYKIDETDRASSVGVTAWIGDEESPEATLDLSLTVTTSLDVWTIDDPSPDHPSFVKFTNGNASTVNWENRAEATFYINASTEFQQIADTVSSITFLVGFIEATGTSPFDFAPAKGSYYSYYPTSGPMAEGATYYMFINNQPDSWGVEDKFAKIEAVSVVPDGNYYKCTFKISYQNENGLRWLVD